LLLGSWQPLRAQFVGHVTGPYRQRVVPAVDFRDSDRLSNLIQAGELRLSLQDCIALALENNLDIELQRYNPRIADADLQKAKAGGVPKGFSLSLQPGSEGTTGTATSSGPGTPSLEPVLVSQINLKHQSQPLTNSFTNGTSNLISNSRLSNFGIQKSFLTGTTVNFGWNNSWLNQNSARADFNPSTTGSMGLTVTQHLLQGFGLAVNSRNILIAKNNRQVSELVFKQQVIATISSVISLYWDLVSLNEDSKVKRQSLELAQKLLADNRQRVELGSLAAIEISRSEAEVARAEQDVTVAESELRQQETVLKNNLSRGGVSQEPLAGARIILTDALHTPDSVPVAPVHELFGRAFENRPEMLESSLQVENLKTGLKGTKSALLPSLDLIASVQNNALAGQVNPLPMPGPTAPRVVNPTLLGGYGTVLSQIFSRDFPDYWVGFQLTIPLTNHAAQADMARDQLGLRQQEIKQRQIKNQIQVEVTNAVTAAEQARARYQAALKFRTYQQQTFEAEQARYELGASTSFFVIQAQRDLAQAKSSEIAALTAYNKARTELDRSTGETIAANNIVLEEAMRGEISHVSPAVPKFK
jgi:outer membrane protein TolC